MKLRPISLTVISWLFIIFGAIALIAGLWPLIHMSSAERLVDFEKHWMVHLSRTAQIIAGVFILRGKNWARWLLVIWLAFHVIVGALHSTFQLVTHVVVFALGMFLLFRRNARDYFRSR